MGALAFCASSSLTCLGLGRPADNASSWVSGVLLSGEGRGPGAPVGSAGSERGLGSTWRSATAALRPAVWAGSYAAVPANGAAPGRSAGRSSGKLLACIGLCVGAGVSCGSRLSIEAGSRPVPAGTRACKSRCARSAGSRRSGGTEPKATLSRLDCPGSLGERLTLSSLARSCGRPTWVALEGGEFGDLRRSMGEKIKLKL